VPAAGGREPFFPAGSEGRRSSQGAARENLDSAFLVTRQFFAFKHFAQFWQEFNHRCKATSDEKLILKMTSAVAEPELIGNCNH
jgi:hypothetical protein